MYDRIMISICYILYVFGYKILICEGVVAKYVNGFMTGLHSFFFYGFSRCCTIAIKIYPSYRYRQVRNLILGFGVWVTVGFSFVEPGTP
jgi:hypothetical protein